MVNLRYLLIGANIALVAVFVTFSLKSNEFEHRQLLDLLDSPTIQALGELLPQALVADDAPEKAKSDAETIEEKSEYEYLKEKNNEPLLKEADETGPLNIVLLYGDDWTLKTLGTLNKFVKTPNLDKMADQGMLFTHNCVTTSICMVSRATLYTGQYASRHETYLPQDRAMFREGVWNETVFSLLQKNGYHTGMVGKWHHAPPPRGTFDMFRSYYASHYIERNGVTKHVTQWNEEDALEFLEKRPKNKLFALMVSFFAIHAEDFGTEKYRPQDKSMSLYVNITIPTPKTATDKHFHDLPHFFRNGRNFGRGRWKGRYNTPTLYQKMMKNMYRMVTEVDETCGKILAKLKEQGVMDNTLVIFTTDNGNLHGEHGLAEKWFPFEESIRVPLIVQDPRMSKSMVGTPNQDFTLNIDLAPTMLSAAKIPVPTVMQGRDMSELYMSNDKSTAGTSPDKAWRDEFFYEWFTGSKQDLPASLALVRKDSKYVVWPDWDNYEQLFRLDNDPFEEKDLYSSTLKTDKSMLEAMKQRMAELKLLAKSGVPM